MIPNIVTLAQAVGQRASGPSIVPPVTVTDAVSIPLARQPSPAGAYFGLFKLCSCGHSSAWHADAFGEAWRNGLQVQGGCEAADEASSSSCGCGSFKAADLG